MDRKPLIGVSICAVVLLVMGSLSNVVGYQTVQSSNQQIINDTVNLTVEFYGLNSSYSINLTHAQEEEISPIFESINQQLKSIKTKEEAEELITDALLSLAAVGVFPGGALNQAMKLVMQPTQTPLLNHKRFMSNQNLSGNTNCYVIGNTSVIYYARSYTQVLNTILNLPWVIGNKVFSSIWKPIVFVLKAIICHLPLIIISFFASLLPPDILFLFVYLLYGMTIPFQTVMSCIRSIGSYIALIPYLSFYRDSTQTIDGEVQHAGIMFGYDGEGPSEGWVTTVGDNGNVSWNGSFYGQLPIFPYIVGTTHGLQFYDCLYYYPGAIGFQGVRIGFHYFIGNAQWVNLGSDPVNPWKLVFPFNYNK